LLPKAIGVSPDSDQSHSPIRRLQPHVFNFFGSILTTDYGPQAPGIHGVDNSESTKRMPRVSAILAVFIAKWCGLEKIR
jgi:hypothetical protein